MKKRVLSMLLALALCMGLAVPAFAAEVDDALKDINDGAIWLDIKDLGGLAKEVSVQFRSWAPNSPSKGTYTKQDALPAVTITVLELPLGVTLIAGPDNKLAENIFVYSDPDGDGIYEQRLMRSSQEGTELVPLTEVGPLRENSTTAYYGMYSWSYGHDWLGHVESNDYTGYRVMTTDFLVGAFGSNTIVELRDPDSRGSMYYLLTGEERPEDLAYDKLESYGIYFSNLGNLVSSWAVEYANTATNQNLLQYKVAEDHDFDLRGKITRGQFACVAVWLYVNMAKKDLTAPEENPFEDVAEDSAYLGDIALAHDLGIVEGYPDGTFGPDDLVTREQAATMLARVYAKLGGEVPEVDATTFSDDALISAWAKGAVAFMTEKNIIGGMGGNTFAPKDNATVEQALKIAVEMLNNLEVE